MMLYTEYERNMIACMLNDATSCEYLCKTLKQDDFTGHYQQIFKLIMKRRKEGHYTDAFIVKDALSLPVAEFLLTDTETVPLFMLPDHALLTLKKRLELTKNELENEEISDLVFRIKQIEIDGTLSEATSVINIADRIDAIAESYVRRTNAAVSTGWLNLDDHYKVKPCEMTIVTGYPSHGKSEFLDAMMINVARQKDWKFAIFSPENFPIEEHMKKMIDKYIERPLSFECDLVEKDMAQIVEATAFLSKHFYHVSPPEGLLTIDNILRVMKSLIDSKGVNGCVLDPWNEIEHKRPAYHSETEYISYTLSRIRRFARDNKVHFWVVAHPSKPQKDDTGHFPVPNAYAISGSANWRNKADNVLVVHKVNENSTESPVNVHVQKVRFKSTGKIGVVGFNYHRLTGCYTERSYDNES